MSIILFENIEYTTILERNINNKKSGTKVSRVLNFALFDIHVPIMKHIQMEIVTYFILCYLCNLIVSNSKCKTQNILHKHCTFLIILLKLQ